MSDEVKSESVAPTVSKLRRVVVGAVGDKNARALAGLKTDVISTARDSLTAKGRKNVANLAKWKDRHQGERCVIIGNGPSLNQTDLSLLKNETTFGLNRIYMMFEKLGFETTYHTVVNRLVVQQCANDFMELKAPLFTTWPNFESLGDTAGTFYLNKLVGPRFSEDLTKGIWEGATVTFVAMQIAYYMGFKDVVLVGVDHNFVSTGPAHKVVQSEGADPNHFDPNYFGKGFKWQLPDLETSEIAYALAGRAFEARGGRIVDATVGGKLQLFPKMSLAEALH
jgi:hypothetical protein